MAGHTTCILMIQCATIKDARKLGERLAKEGYYKQSIDKGELDT